MGLPLRNQGLPQLSGPLDMLHATWVDKGFEKAIDGNNNL